MKKYTWIVKLGKSLVPSEFYIHILQESIGRAIGYMVLFILLLSVTVGLYTGFQLKTGIDGIIKDYDDGTIPATSIINNELSVEGEGIIPIDHFDSLIILDDESNYSVNDILANDNLVLFGKNGVSISRRGIGPLVYDYSDFLFYDIISTELISYLTVASAIMIPMSIITQFFASLFSFFFNSVFILLMVNIIRTFVGLGLRMKQLYHMTIYAMTFSVFWTHFITLLPSQVPYWLNTFVYYVIPSIILLNVFMIIRKRAVEEIKKKR